MTIKQLYKEVNKLILKYCFDSKFITTIQIFPKEHQVLKDEKSKYEKISIDIHYWKDGDVPKSYSRDCSNDNTLFILQQELPIFVKQCEEYASQATN